MKGLKWFVKGLFLDDVKEPCVGRFSLILGMILTTFTATFAMGTEGEVSYGEALVRTGPAIAGLVAYIFTRLYESREWLAEKGKEFKELENKGRKK